jgi:hypothetical protein
MRGEVKVREIGYLADEFEPFENACRHRNLLIAVEQCEDKMRSTLSFLVRLATNDRSLEPIPVRDSDRPFAGFARTRLPCYPIHFFVSLVHNLLPRGTA